MTALKVHTVDSLAQYAKRIEALLDASGTRSTGASYKGNWYRGVGSSDKHKLVPSLYRHPEVRELEALLKLERRMLDDFVRQNVLHTSMPIPVGLDDALRSLYLLFYLQHYGIPTRLLDWSTNPFIALYFALSSAHMAPDGKTCVEDAAVWVLDPVAWNHAALQQIEHENDGPLSHDADVLVTSFGPRKLTAGKLEATAIPSMYDHPAAILGVSNSARMLAQRGVFTVFGRSTDPMEDQYAAGGFKAGSLQKIVIPKADVSALFQRLLSIGYTDSVSYPDLNGLTMEIKRSHGFRV